MTRARLLSLVPALLLLVAGCGNDGTTITASPPSTTASATAASAGDRFTGDLALVATSNGLAGVPVGSSEPLWSTRGTVAALDGSAVYAAEHNGARTRLIELDAATGEELRSWDLQGNLDVKVVAPDGAAVALTEVPDGQGSPSYRPALRRASKVDPNAATELVVFKPSTGEETQRHRLDGMVLPEAFSLDLDSLFTLRLSDDHYRVETVDVATGDQFDTLGRDKLAGENMYGEVVHGVLNADGTLLSTLYREEDDARHPAFVHVVDLLNEWAHCVDLTGPFGTGPDGSDELVAHPDMTVSVVHHADEGTATVANINVDALHNQNPETPIAVNIEETATPPGLPEGVSDVTGFQHLVAVISVA